MTVVVGGVAQLYQGDLDLGRVAVERLSAEEIGREVLVEDFHYGGVAVAQRLEEVRPSAFVLVGAEQRDRPPGTVERRRIHGPTRPREELRVAVESAVTGYVSIDLVIDVAAGLEVLPERTVSIEVEPASIEFSESLSPEGETALDAALALVRAEVERLPVLAHADRLRAVLAERRLGSGGAGRALRRLLDELELVDREGRWGETFRLRERLRREIRAGHTEETMTALDWGLWWTLIEELDRLQPPEERIGTESSPNGHSSAEEDS